MLIKSNTIIYLNVLNKGVSVTLLRDLIGGRGSCFHIIQLLAIVIPLVLLLILAPTIPKSYAHAFVIKSNPSPSQSLTTPPAKVDVYFSEPVDQRYSKLSVIDPNGKQIDNKDIKNVNGDQSSLSVTLPSSLKDGVYTVITKVLSQVDGHVTDNAFVFGVGESGASKDLSVAAGANINKQGSQLYIPDAIARFPALVGQVIIVGSAFTALWLWRPISKINWLNDVLMQTRKSIDRRLTILMIIGSAILVISDFGIIYVQAASINVGISEAIMTKFGNVWIVRVVLSFVLLITSLLEYRKLKKDNDKIVISKEGIISLLAIGLVTLLTTSLVGHGAANGMLLPITIDLIHNLAASIWIGGVIYLALVVVPAIRKSTSLDEFMKISLISVIIPRFSSIPIVILGIIIITGPSLLYILESNLGLTLASLYGKILIAKLLLATAMIFIGGFNQFIVHKKALGVLVTEVSTGSNTQLLSAPDIHKNIDKDKLNKEKRRGTIWRKIRPYSNGSKNNTQNNNSIIPTFSKSLKIESIVGIMLLMSVAFLVNTGLPASEFQNQLQPNQQPQQQQQQQQSTASSTSSYTPVAASTGDNNSSSTGSQNGFISTKFLDNGSKMTLSIDPFSIGNNNFKIVFTDLAGDPIGIKSAQMKFNQIEEGIGPINVNAQQIAKGVFSANTPAFSLPGKWEVQVEGVQTKPNSPNLVAIYEIPVKPNLDQLQFNVREFKIPGNNTSQPLYPLFDNSRNVIWTGDTSISSGSSGRIFEFDLNSHKFTEHKINDTNIITVMALDRDGRIWYVDPLMKNLGHYNPENNKNQIYKIPNPDFIPSGIAIDRNDNVWLTSAASNEILRFNSRSQPAAANNFTAFYLPSANATSLGITVDDESGQIWIAEDIGKLANIDPTTNYKIVEYSPEGKDNALKDPTGLLVDPVTGDIYISEHEGHSVGVFDPILKKFDKRYTDLDPNGLPFGMAMDKYGNLWVAEHTVNKIAVIDSQTGDHKEIEIPAATPFVQWITSDSNGNIWLAEQRGNALASITSNENLSQSSLGAAGSSSEASNSAYEGVTIPFGLSYADIIGPSIAAGIVICTLFYTKSIVDFKKSMNQILRRKSQG
jgi:copper transport protein